MDDPIKPSEDAQPADTFRDRRSFLVGAASAGILGAAGIAPALAQSGASTGAVSQDPQAPKGLGSRAMVDNRFPLTYQQSIPQAARIVTEYHLQERPLGTCGHPRVHHPARSFERHAARLT